MRIHWTEKARHDLNSIQEFISEDSPATAIQSVIKIINTVEVNLNRHPGIGRPGRHPRTRELVITGTPYIVPYQVSGETVSIYRVLHGAMQWPEEF